MEDTAWWALHAVQSMALIASLGLALAAGRRPGLHTPYGLLLTTLGLGFLFLIAGDAVFLTRKAMGAWQGPGGLTDALGLTGWVLLTSSVGLFVLRYRVSGGSAHTQGAAVAVTLIVPFAVVVGAFLLVSPVGADPDAPVRLAYILVDGAGMGLIVTGLDRFRRLADQALGRLYVLLGVALVLKTAGDIGWAFLAARGESALWATLPYPLAGLVAVAALAVHLRDLRTEWLPRSGLAEAWLHPGQRALRDMAAHVQAAAGGHAARSVLTAAAATLDDAGHPARVEADVVLATAPDGAWKAAIAAARRHGERLGVAATGGMGAIEDTYARRPGTAPEEGA